MPGYPWSNLQVLDATDLNGKFASVDAANTAEAATRLAADNALSARVTTLEDTNWTDYTGGGQFALTSSGTQPTLGNSVITARYKTEPGKVTFQFDITIGSTFTAGTGNYRIKLPIASADFLAVGAALVVDVSVPTFFPSIVIPIGGNLGNAEIYRAVAGTPTGAPFGAASFTLATGDIIRGQLEYKP